MSIFSSSLANFTLFQNLYNNIVFLYYEISHTVSESLKNQKILHSYSHEKCFIFFKSLNKEYKSVFFDLKEMLQIYVSEGFSIISVLDQKNLSRIWWIRMILYKKKLKVSHFLTC